MTMQKLLARLGLTILLLLGSALPASAAVTITFWSHELGNMFPHAFITLRGAPDAGGPPVDMNIGFTPKHLSPSILFGTVAGMLEPADVKYLKNSDAHFSLVLTDAQYVEVLKVIDEWGPNGDQHYHMNKRNCVTFTQVVAQRLGLRGTDQPKLIKRPRSYMIAVQAANLDRVTVVHQHGDAFIATLAAVPGVDPNAAPLTGTGTVAPQLALLTPASGARPAPAPTAVITSDSMSMGNSSAGSGPAAASR